MTTEFKQAIMDLFDKLKRNALHLAYQPAETPVAVGQSKIGGQPDVPGDFVWPYYEGKDWDEVIANRPLTFMAQINLAEAAALDKDGLLPKQGLLSFFYEMATEKWGFDPEDKGCAKVYYFADAAGLAQRDFPEDLDEEYRLPEFAVSMKALTDLPDYFDFRHKPETQGVPEQYPEDVSKFGWNQYEKLRAEYGCKPPEDGWSETTKLLGYPNVIQNPMEFECEKVSRGLYDGRPDEISEELTAEIEAASQDWILLFQMGTVEEGDFELMFGDVGHIYYWIRKQDLATGNFDNVWLILQCS